MLPKSLTKMHKFLTRTNEAATPAGTLAGEDTLPPGAQLPVSTEHVTNLTDLAVTLALGVEVGTTLATAHVD
jgi:hypothetical protein